MAEGKGRGIARMACAVGLTAAMTLGGLPLAAQPAWAQGTLAITAAAGNEDMKYDAYQIFTGTVGESEGKRVITGVTWNEAAKASFDKAVEAYVQQGGEAFSGTTAQDAADYLAAQTGESTASTIVGRTSLAGLLAQQLVSNEVAASGKITAGEAGASLADGYYLVLSNRDSLAAGDAVTGGRAATAPVLTLVGGGETTTIHEKASVPTLAKQVREDSTGTYGLTADANAGQAVSYRLQATLPKNLASYGAYHLKFTDHLSAGLTYGGDAKVSVLHQGDTEPEELGSGSTATISCTKEDATGGDASKAAGNVLTVDIADLKRLRTASDKAIEPTDTIVVEYTAKLNGDSTIGWGGNTNKAELVYSNDPHASTEGTTKPAEANLFTYQLNVHKRDMDKQDKGDADRGLAGAKFTLKLTEPDGSTGDKTVDEDLVGKYVQADGSLGDTAHDFVSNEDGAATIPHIDAGTYELAETTPPAGYNTMGEAFTIEIRSNRAEGGRLDVSATGSEHAAAHVETATDTSTGQIDVTVRDTKNVGMPQTGSAGFAAMIAGGGSLVAVSLAALLRRRH